MSYCHVGIKNLLKCTKADVELQGNDVATVLDSGDRLGRTPLHYAASQKTGPNCLQGRGRMSSKAKIQMGAVNMHFNDFLPRSLLHLEPAEGRGKH